RLEGSKANKKSKQKILPIAAQMSEQQQQQQQSVQQEQQEQEQQEPEQQSAEQQLPQQKQQHLSQEQELQTREALNQQTAIQFRQYAAEQHPNNAAKQQELISQLQEQHYQQYISMSYEQQLHHQREQARQLLMQRRQPNSSSPSNQEAANVAVESLDGGAETDAAGDDEAPPASADSGTAVLPISPSGDPALEGIDEPLPEMPQLIPASIWTRQNIAEFKKEILRDSKHCCIKIGSLATATVRVPTHEEGTCIVWEFATDHYDLGFGVYFEWTITPSDKVTVQISESSDEEDDDEGEDGEAPRGEGDVERPDDPERGSRRRRDDDKSIDEIIPVYRRDCHEEVYCGSHQYPGRGVYLLKFDNSYSLWRSKWLYYRVFYTR
ncbi:hypothetical protein BOX15_Mlig024842g1, partial [Macrostomum lignano]